MHRTVWATLACCLFFALPADGQSKRAKPKPDVWDQAEQQLKSERRRPTLPANCKEVGDISMKLGRLADLDEESEEFRQGVFEGFTQSWVLTLDRCAEWAEAHRRYALALFTWKQKARWEFLKAQDMEAVSKGVLESLQKDYNKLAEKYNALLEDFNRVSEADSRYIAALKQSNAALESALKNSEANERVWRLLAAMPAPPQPPPRRDPLTCTGRVMNLGSGMATTYTTCY